MDLEGFHDLVSSYPGVRRRTSGSAVRWQLNGRLVARPLDASHVVIRVPFDVRDLLLREAPDVFSVPDRMARHMLVVADLGVDDGAVEQAVDAAYRLQSGDTDDTDD